MRSGDVGVIITRDDIPQRAVVVDVVEERESEGQPEIVTVDTVTAPARIPIGGYVSEEGEHVYRYSDTDDVDVRAGFTRLPAVSCLSPAVSRRPGLSRNWTSAGTVTRVTGKRHRQK